MEATGLEMTKSGCQATSGHTAAQGGGQEGGRKGSSGQSQLNPIHTFLQTLQHEDFTGLLLFLPFI